MMVTLAMLLIGFVTTVSVDSMDTWANDINSQVSVKKRMPMGKKTKLTSSEYEELLTWISSTKTSTNGI